MKKYFIVDSSILPSTFGKVIKARDLINSGRVKRISQAAKTVGISRGTYYKYKDYVFTSNHRWRDRKAVISLMLQNQRGILSKVLSHISQTNASILTINQNIPIHNVASVVISLDLSSMHGTMHHILTLIRTIPGTRDVHLVSIE